LIFQKGITPTPNPVFQETVHSNPENQNDPDNTNENLLTRKPD